uniref:Putative secreted protein n=1 Tax=Anopheles darlingi TaxID=43151 RepID=A0A2M4D511_ANODA
MVASLWLCWIVCVMQHENDAKCKFKDTTACKTIQSRRSTTGSNSIVLKWVLLPLLLRMLKFGLAMLQPSVHLIAAPRTNSVSCRTVAMAFGGVLDTIA